MTRAPGSRARLAWIVLAAALSCSDDPDLSPPEEPLGNTSVGPPAKSLAEFEAVMERIRSELKIPGLSAAIVKSGELVWARGFGQANRKAATPAAEETVYHLASLTKPFAATIIMRLVEENSLDLDDPVAEYGVDLGDAGTVTVRHLLSHTSEGIPGAAYHYSGNRFAHLDAVILAAAGRSFCELLDEWILLPLGMTSTGPNPDSPGNCLRNDPRNGRIEALLAQGYSPNGQHEMPYPSYFGTAAGMVSSVRDLASFSIGLDDDLLLTPASRALMFAPTRSNGGEELPYGLGWFVDNNDGVTILWHYGFWDAISTLIVKVPEKGLAFVVLANSDRLSSASPGIGSDEDVNRSVAAQEFLNAFVFGTAPLPDDPPFTGGEGPPGHGTRPCLKRKAGGSSCAPRAGEARCGFLR